MSDFLEELTVILTIVWWLRKLDKDCQKVNEHCKFWYGIFNLRKVNGVEIKKEH